MERNQAIDIADKLNDMGYSTKLVCAVHPNHMPERSYHITLAELSIDMVDFKALIELADREGVTIAMSSFEAGMITFMDPPTTPAAIASPRKHPR